MLTWHFWPLQKKAIAHPSFSLPKIRMCTPTGYTFPSLVCCRVRPPKPSSQLILQPKESHVCVPPHSSSPKNALIPRFWCSHAALTPTAQARQLGARLGAKITARVCSRSSALLAGSSPQRGCASGQAHPSRANSSAQDLTGGRDRGMTRAGVQGLGLCPGREDDQRGKKVMPLPAGR